MSSDPQPQGSSRSKSTAVFIVVVVVCAALVFGVTALLMNIFQRKQEAKKPVRAAG